MAAMIWILLLLSTSSAFIPLNDIVLRNHLLDKLPDELASLSSSLSSTSEKPVEPEESGFIVDKEKAPVGKTGLSCKIIEEASGPEGSKHEETFASNPRRRNGKESKKVSSTSTEPTVEKSKESSVSSTTSSSTSTTFEKPKTPGSRLNSTLSTNTTTTKPGKTLPTKPGRPEPKCEDKFPRCKGIKKLCANKRYSSIMSNACARTCGFCEVKMYRPIACYDKTPEECASHGNTNFCHAYFLREPEKVSNCQKTCGLC